MVRDRRRDLAGLFVEEGGNFVNVGLLAACGAMDVSRTIPRRLRPSLPTLDGSGADAPSSQPTRGRAAGGSGPDSYDADGFHWQNPGIVIFVGP